MKTITACALACICFNLVAQDKIRLVPVASGLSVPVDIANAGDDQLFVVEKSGYIQIMDTSGQVMQQPFLDIHSKVNSSASERGFLGVAFHPDYAENGYFFVNYTNTSGNTVIARYSRDTLDTNLADPSSELILLTVTQPYSNHNGGNLVFGPDGYLYCGLGDGGNAGDPGNRAQNLQELLGKILRLDVDSSPYGIPASNPFAGVDTVRQEIWAYGMRNPWRFTFDRETGDLWIGDVGQDAWEEVDYEPAGDAGGNNYGWRCREGLANYNTSGCPSGDAFIDPVYVYAHTGGNCSGSITGGFVYRGTLNAYLYSKYVFTDYCTGVFRAVWKDNEGNFQSEQLADLLNNQYTSFGEDMYGELFVAAANGTIYRIEDIVSSVSEPVIVSGGIIPNPVSARFSFADADGAQITYRLHDLYGHEVLSGTTSKEVDCSNLPPGAYLVEWETSQGHQNISKMIIMR